MFARSIVALLLATFGVLWLLYFVAPLLIGVPATWANAPLLLFAAPSYGAFAAAWFITR